MSGVEQQVWPWRRLAAVAGAGVLGACVAAGCGSDDKASPTSPTPTTATVVSVAISGTTTSFAQQGATSQFTATVTLSDNKTEDRTAAAAWRSDNPAVATVSAQGLVTAVGDGQAVISATVSEKSGTLGVSVALPKRTPDPAAGQRLPLPDVRGLIQQWAAERPGMLEQQSCPNGIKYVNNPFQDYIVDRLRQLDTRWGYNAKPTRTARDNNGVAVVAAGDELAYHYGSGPDQGSPDVYLVDIIESHCGTPRLTWRVFTGEEPGRWTGAGRF